MPDDEKDEEIGVVDQRSVSFWGMERQMKIFTRHWKEKVQSQRIDSKMKLHRNRFKRKNNNRVIRRKEKRKKWRRRN